MQSRVTATLYAQDLVGTKAGGRSVTEAFQLDGVHVHLDHEAREGYMLVAPGAGDGAIAAGLELFESRRWAELGVDETGDLPETLDDGSIKVLFIPTYV